MYVPFHPRSVLNHLMWLVRWLFFLFCLGTNCLCHCCRFTPSCGTLLTTTPVYGPGSVSGTHGHLPTPYGYLKGTVQKKKPSITHKWIIFFCIGIYLKHTFSRAAEKGNFEAAVKLGIAYLYNEGRKLNSYSTIQWEYICHLCFSTFTDVGTCNIYL